jgi:hypothetical protein
MSITIGKNARIQINREGKFQIISEYPSLSYTPLRTFYISDTLGDDTRTVAQAQNQATPWKTMRKVEQFGNGSLGSYPNKAAAGDAFKFKSGETFYCTDRSFGGFRWWGGSYGSSPSGTSSDPIIFTSYGTGDKPNLLFPDSTLEAWEKVVFHFEGTNYVKIDGIQFNDPRSPVASAQNPYTASKIGGARTGQAIFLGEGSGSISCNNNIVTNCYTNNIGYGISVCGDNNIFTYNYFENFGQAYPFTDASYGQISVQITGNNNVIKYNTMKGGWAWAETFSWNGGTIEFVDASNNTTVMYNTIVDCSGITELGISNPANAGATISNILFAYNKVINCGDLAYVNPNITASNIQIYNNVVIENSLSRFSGINFASGAQDFPTYQTASCPKRPYPAQTAISYHSSQNQYPGVLYDVKNNVFVTSNAPIVIANDYNFNTGLCNATNTYTLSVGANDARSVYNNNVYKLTNGATVGHTLQTGEQTTSTQLFTNITGNNPELWDYYPLASSILINTGTNVGLSPDFVGNPVSNPPEIGILEYI